MELGSRSDECDGGDLGDGDADADGTNDLSFSGLYGENDEADTLVVNKVRRGTDEWFTQNSTSHEILQEREFRMISSIYLLTTVSTGTHTAIHTPKCRQGRT